MDFEPEDVEDWMHADESNDSQPADHATAIDVHNHAMPLPLLEWLERAGLSEA